MLASPVRPARGRPMAGVAEAVGNLLNAVTASVPVGDRLGSGG